MDDINWETIAAQTGILAFVFTVLAYFLRPLLDKYFMSSFDRNESEIKARVLKMVEERVVISSQRVQEQLDRQDTALEAIAKTTAETAGAVRYIQGLLDSQQRGGWDGQTERRQRRDG